MSAMYSRPASSSESTGRYSGSRLSEPNSRASDISTRVSSHLRVGIRSAGGLVVHMPISRLNLELAVKFGYPTQSL
jgi:hypothetical protein